LKKWVWVRRFSQIFFTGLFIYALAASIQPGHWISPKPWFWSDPLAMFSLSISSRTFVHGLGWSILFVLASVFLGRFFCGWLCPMGALGDLVGSLRKKKRKLSPETNRFWRKPKYILLAVLGLLALAGFQEVWFFDPIVIAGRFISMNLLPVFAQGLNTTFIFLIKHIPPLDTPLTEAYRCVRQSVLGSRLYTFSNAFPIFLYFAVLALAGLWVARLWCRTLCPLGAIYALFSRKALLARRVDDCSSCRRCQRDCRMAAIGPDLKTVPGECILCMDCIYECPGKKTYFSFKPRVRAKTEPVSGGLSRKDFLVLFLVPVFLAGFRRRRRSASRESGAQEGPLRPPGALAEKDFLNRCIRCGNCMKACPTNGLQPSVIDDGWSALWVPRLLPNVGACEYNCNQCGSVCPTGAIRPLPLALKQKVRIGLAEIDRSRCLNWTDQDTCLVCEEHCPLPEKAIQLVHVRGRSRPVVDVSRCIGCGLCQNVCPAEPVRAIRVYPLSSQK